MERVYETGAAGSAPAAPAAPSSGYPSAGDPGLGVPPTYPGPYWFHQIMEELRAVIVAGGQTPSHTTLNQLLLALQAGFGLGKSISASGYITLPGGLIVQWGTGINQAGEGGQNITLPITFPNGFLRAVVGTTLNEGVLTMGLYTFISCTTNTLRVYRRLYEGADASGSTPTFIAVGY